MKRTNVIIGDGIAGYVIAACLDYLGEDFTIYGTGKYHAPDILLLKTDYQLSPFNDIIKNDLFGDKCFQIFDIPEKVKTKYLEKITIGFMTADNLITYDPTKSILKDYYDKQGRKKSKSSMSDGRQSFVAIKLKDIYPILVDKYKQKFVKSEVTRDMLETFKDRGNINIYNTIFETTHNKHEATLEYIVREHNPFVIDYVYDCRYYSSIKRFTKNYTEYFQIPANKNYITIKNYYQSPEIYTTHDNINNWTQFDISRNATKTQLKIEDIIRFLLKY